MEVRGAKIEVGDTVLINGRRVYVESIRPAIHRPDVTRVLTEIGGRETVINTRNKYKVAYRVAVMRER